MIGAAEPSRIGQVVGGKYRIVRLLSQGGMGVVYEAQHAVVRRRFAIKFLRRDLAARREILTRFQREAESAGALENENVAAAVDFGISEDGAPYIVMEHLVGESLAALLEREPEIPATRAADLVLQACRGVAAAHAAGIVHRDLKPQNLFVCRRDDGTDLVKVLDFGVAKLQALDEASAATDTGTGTMLGTAAYMSPEQARGDKTVDGRADVYALGAILYELLSHKRPHPGASQNAILHHIATQPAVPLASVAAGVPAALAELVAAALAPDPGARPGAPDALAQALAPFARRDVWPPPPEAPAPRPDPASPASPGSTPLVRHRPRWAVGVGALALLAIALSLAIVARHHNGGKRLPDRPPPGATAARGPARPLEPGTRFLSAEPPPGAVLQIETLLKGNDTRDAALLSAMVATPSAFWFLGGSPQQVQAEVSDAVARGGRQGRVPVLVAYNHPFRDCTGYGLIGSSDTPSYRAWIDGFAAAIGNEKAVVILEPNSLGLVPYGTALDGTEDKCKPTRAEADSRRIAPPGATPDERYAQLAYAVDTLAAKAPNAAVYLDGTHSNWLATGDAAYRLARAGVARAAGFFLNAGNYQPTERLVQYGTWVSKCLRLAQLAGAGPNAPAAYRDCASTPKWTDPDDEAVWAKVDAWYAEHFDRRAGAATGPAALTHFVLNTNRNGRGPLRAEPYAKPPYNQPPAVIEALRYGSWCMPPGRGLGIRPTANTGLPLVDAFLWTDTPGLSVASCDVAGGARAWDYGKYNPWGIEGDAQNHFDPLWGRVLPPAGDWFPDEALQLARNATPPLEGGAPDGVAALAATPPPGRAATAGAARPLGRPAGHKRTSGQPATPTAAAPPPSGTERPAEKTALPPPVFDAQNPYR